VQQSHLVPGVQVLDGLAPVPNNPGPSFERLSRCDLAGLIWLHRRVIAMTDSTAVQPAVGLSSIVGTTNRRLVRSAIPWTIFNQEEQDYNNHSRQPVFVYRLKSDILCKF
jgi:hypothetical protein